MAATSKGLQQKKHNTGIKEERCFELITIHMNYFKMSTVIKFAILMKSYNEFSGICVHDYVL